MTWTILVRHGESESNAGISKDLNSRLTENGRQQAFYCAREIQATILMSRKSLNDFVIVSSPYQRCVETANEVAKLNGSRPTISDGVREWGPTTEIEGRFFAAEDRQELVQRLSDWWTVHHDRDLIIVSHGSPVAIMKQLAFGESPNVEGNFWRDVRNCRPYVIIH